MAMPRKSEAVHELQGTRPHYSTTGAHTSHIEGGRPKAPRWLTPVAAKKFRELAKQLVARRVATPGDADLLVLAATLWERWRIASDHVLAEGAIVTVQYFSKTGTPYTRERKNPHLEVAQVTEKQLLSVLQQLGLTIATRDKAKMTNSGGEPSEQKSFADAYLEGVASSRIIPMKPEHTDD